MGLLDNQNLFHRIPDAFAVVRTKKGTYKQVPVYIRGKDLFAGVAGGFVSLRENGGTSNPDITLDSLIAPQILLEDKQTLGRLQVKAIIAVAGPTIQGALPPPESK